MAAIVVFFGSQVVEGTSSALGTVLPDGGEGGGIVLVYLGALVLVMLSAAGVALSAAVWAATSRAEVLAAGRDGGLRHIDRIRYRRVRVWAWTNIALATPVAAFCLLWVVGSVMEVTGSA